MVRLTAAPVRTTRRSQEPLHEAGPALGRPRISQLAYDGADLTAGSRAACEGSAVCLSNRWNGVSAVQVCTDPATYGHADRYRRIGMPPILRPSIGSSVTALGQLAGFIPPSTAYRPPVRYRACGDVRKITSRATSSA